MYRVEKGGKTKGKMMNDEKQTEEDEQMTGEAGGGMRVKKENGVLENVVDGGIVGKGKECLRV